MTLFSMTLESAAAQATGWALLQDQVNLAQSVQICEAQPSTKVS